MGDTNPEHVRYITENYGAIDGVKLCFSYNTQQSKEDMLKKLSEDYEITYMAIPPFSSDESRKKLHEKESKKINKVVNIYKEVNDILKNINIISVFKSITMHNN